MKPRAGLAFLPYAVFLLLAAISWNRWIEPFVDTGRELMVPARVAQGERLYRDVRFYYGPLAPYVAAGVDVEEIDRSEALYRARDRERLKAQIETGLSLSQAFRRYPMLPVRDTTSAGHLPRTWAKMGTYKIARQLLSE